MACRSTSTRPTRARVERFVRAHGVNAFYDSVELRKHCCAIRKTEPLAPRAGRQGRVDHRPAPRAVGHARATSPSRSSTPCTASPKFNPLADWTRRRRLGLHARAPTCPYNALHDRGYPQHRLRAVHARGRAGRGRARRPLVVGEPGAQGMRPASAPGRHSDRRKPSNASSDAHDARAFAELDLRAAPATRRRRPPTRDHLDWLESEAIHILREVAGQCRNPALLFSGGKDSLVLLRLAEKAFRPGAFPFPLLHIDTGHNFPEVIAFRDARAAELGERLIVRSVEDSIASGRVVLQRPGREPQRAPVGDAARRDRRVRLRRLHRRRAPRRGEGARQGARLLVPRRVRPVGSEEPAPRAVEPVQRARRTRASTCACSRSATGPSSTCGSTSRASASTCRRSTSRTRAPVVRRGGALVPVTDADAAARRRGRRARVGALSHRRRHHLHGAGRVRRARPSHAIIAETAAATITERGATRLDDQTTDASMELRKKEGLLLMSAIDRLDAARPRRAAVPHRGQRRRRQEHADRPPALRHQGDPRRPARGGRAHVAAARPARSTCRSSPTASPPSASRASRSTSRTATSPPRGASSSSPTRRATSSTRATWSPRRRTAQLAILLVDARHGVVDADAAPRDARASARHSAPGRRGQQDGPGRLSARTCSRAIVADFRAFAERTRHRRRALRPDVGARRRHGRRPRRAPRLVRRPDAAGDPGDDAESRRDAARAPFRFPVQFVARPDRRRGRAATSAASKRARSPSAMRVTVLPSGRTTTRARDPHARRRAIARAGCTTPVTLDARRRDRRLARRHARRSRRRARGRARSVDADAVLARRARRSIARRTYVLRHTTREVRARVDAHRPPAGTSTTQAREPAPGDARDERHRPRRISRWRSRSFADRYADNRATGSFILIDEATQRHRRRGDDPMTRHRLSRRCRAGRAGPAHAARRAAARATPTSCSTTRWCIRTRSRWPRAREKIAVGKRCGKHSTAQHFINKRLVDAARNARGRRAAEGRRPDAVRPRAGRDRGARSGRHRVRSGAGHHRGAGRGRRSSGRR